MASFIHLRLHTEYSIIDGIVRIDKLLQSCATMNMPAVAITDQNNFFGLVKFYKEATKFGIKPILGADAWLLNEEDPEKPFFITFLAQNNTGYKNLLQLLSKIYTSGQKNSKPMLDKSWLTSNLTDGIIALSGGRNGDIGQSLLAGNQKKAEILLNFWLKFFPNRFYIELQRTGRQNEEKYIQAALDLAESNEVPVVATNDVRFIDRKDFEAHEVRVCIHDGYVVDDPNRSRIYSEEQYLKSAQEMCDLFQDIPEAISNSVEITKRCNVTITLGKNFLPIFPVPNQSSTVEEYFEKLTKEGLEKRLEVIFNPSNPNKTHYTKENYYARLQYETPIINQMGFASYFLIVADFINWSKNNDIPVGPGRGSGAGSLVAYALNITNIDPLEHELLFERFLNPERVSLPDFDVDFCMDNRDRVIDYVMQRYGHERVAQIATHGTMAAKAVVRDVGRALGFPYGFVDKIAKLIPFTLGITLSDALKQEEQLSRRYKEEEDVKNLIDLALKLEGLVRNVGKHAGGIVIAPTLLTDFTALYCEPETPDHTITQYDKDDVDAIGLVKFDFLGLRTLTIVADAVKNINKKLNNQESKENFLNIDLLPINDALTYKLLQSGKTTAVFQIESRGMQELAKRMKPDCFEDTYALIALYRPGPLQSGMVEDFVERKLGNANIVYPHPLLENVLKPTYGVILYQEQVMQIARVLSGYTLGEADILRKAMGKKKPEEMAKQRAIFVSGAAKNNVDKHVANTIFDLMEKFAGYGFNKSHSVAYGLISYQTAWLKAHFPAEFMAAVLSADMDNTDKVVKLILECKAMGLKILSPHINASYYQFTVNNSGEIIYGLGAIKGAGESAIEQVVNERLKNGPYKDLFDLCKRSDKQKLNRKLLEVLIKSGSLDELGPNRATMFESINKAMQIADKHAKTQAQKQLSLFGFEEEFTSNEKVEKHSSLYISCPIWQHDTCLSYEKESLGFYLSGHPIERYSTELRQFTTQLCELGSMLNKNVITAGIITKIKSIITKNGKQMAIISLEESFANSEIVVFSELYQEKFEILNIDQLIIIEGEVSMDEFSSTPRLRANDIYTLENARTKYVKKILFKINELKNQENTLHTIFTLLSNYKGGNCNIQIEYLNTKSKAQLALGETWRIQPKDLLLNELRNILGQENVIPCY